MRYSDILHFHIKWFSYTGYESFFPILTVKRDYNESGYGEESDKSFLWIW